ncbi:MAG: aspartate-semialdehyde dehydrogenase [Bdellovibrionota bacterium]
MKIAVVGATGAVGREMLSVLAERDFPVSELVPFASARSVGKTVEYQGKSYAVRALSKGCFAGVDIAFFDASDAVSKEWVPQAAEAGAWVIDNSASFRMDEDLLLCVPEVNGEQLRARVAQGPKSVRERIIAGPNCSTVQLVVALKPLRDHFGIKRVVVSTYQSASGAGTVAMDELTSQTQGVLAGESAIPQAFVHQIAFNCIPQIGGFKHDGYTSEEHKLMAETKRILGMPKLRVAATAIRVPTLSCHGESVSVECEKSFGLDEVRKLLGAQPGARVLDSPDEKIYPMGISASGKDSVDIGRIRRDDSVENGLLLWIVSDNLRKGAALNAVQIGEILVRNNRQ